MEIKTITITDGREISYVICEQDLPGQKDDWINISASMDLETSGLQVKKDKIALAIVHPNKTDEPVYLVRRPTIDSLNLKILIANPKPKLFHHAPFDIGFMKYHWDLGCEEINGIRCTKIAAKILDPKKEICNRNLKELAKQWADTELPKGQAVSNWFANNLGQQQIIYALEDVLYLPTIWSSIGKRLTPSQRAKVIKTCEYLPAYLEYQEDKIKNPYVY